MRLPSHVERRARLQAEQEKRAPSQRVYIPSGTEIEYIVVLPLPHKDLSPNSTAHHLTKARLKKKYRAVAGVVALEHGRPLLQAATVECRFFFKDARPHDGDNLLAQMKSAFDGLADGGLATNDRDFTYLPVQKMIDRNNPRVVIVVRGTPAAAGKEPQ